MKKLRIPETNNGIIGELKVSDYDEFQKMMRDKGFILTDKIIKSGINKGTVLEIGPGPGYLGLEWLKKTEETFLNWLEISEDMKNIALKNTSEYCLKDKIKITVSDATKKFPFSDNTFDAVFTSGSLHEWVNPIKCFNEIERVLKKGGRFFISDLKRNINPINVFLMKMMVMNKIKSKIMKSGFITSINASYLKNELTEILLKSSLKNFNVSENPFGLIITGAKE